VRVQLPEVSNEHCKLVLTEQGQVNISLDIYESVQ